MERRDVMNAERELEEGISADPATRRLLAARIARGETTAGEIAEELRHKVLCSRCGEELEPELLARLWADTDFYEHGDRGHLAAFESTPANFAAARHAYNERLPIA